MHLAPIDNDKAKKLKNAAIRSNSIDRSNGGGPKFSSKGRNSRARRESKYDLEFSNPSGFTETLNTFSTDKFTSRENLNSKFTASSIHMSDVELVSSSSKNIAKKSRPPSTRLLKKFIGTAKLIIFCHRCCMAAYQNYMRTIHRYISFAQLSEKVDSAANSYEDLFRYNKPGEDDEIINTARIKAEMMNFDKKYFKPTERLNFKLPADIVAILNKRDKSDQELEYLRLTFKGMSHLKSINSLPEQVRLQLFKCCWLEEYEPQRIIVNQGYRAELFYIVVSGSLVCTHRPPNERKSRNFHTKQSIRQFK